MDSKDLVNKWFETWEQGNYLDLPITVNFRHTSPFGIVNGKQAYLDLIKQNEDKFLGQTFEVHEGIYSSDRACVRYTARQGKDFSLDVSEWYHINDEQIEEIFAYYHIGDIREGRKLDIR